MDDNLKGYGERTAEELAWDEEFQSDQSSDLGANLQGLVRFALRLPGALVQVPMALVPSESRRHARAAAREGFLAVRSLLGAIGDGIEDILADPSGTGPSATVQGPPGTWGTGRAAMDNIGGTSSSKVKRIAISEDEDGRTPSDMPGDMP